MVDGASFLVFRVSACLEMPSRQGRRLSINIHFLKPFFRFGCPVPFAHASRLRRNINLSTSLTTIEMLLLLCFNLLCYIVQ